MDRTPTHHDAELVLRLYDLRREATLRENRVRMFREYWPRTADDVIAVAQPDHPLNVAYRQVTTYWEMAYVLCKHGTLHTNLMLESSGEGLVMFARLEPHLVALRAATNPRTLLATEWIATQTEIGQKLMEIQRARYAKLLAARKE
ncbi:MAG TPA: hypothetical protein VE967_05895 [Gemmatimonadaceae bacterium]|nr:hypothetical protein [Gemmatimonadaceae bacterium]